MEGKMTRGIDKITFTMLMEAYDINIDKFDVWGKMLSDKDTEDIRNAVNYYIANETKPPKIANIIKLIEDKKKVEKNNNDTHQERWNEEEFLNEIIKANNKNMEVVVERREGGCDIIYWASPLFIPKEAYIVKINNFFFYRIKPSNISMRNC